MRASASQRVLILGVVLGVHLLALLVWIVWPNEPASARVIKEYVTYYDIAPLPPSDAATPPPEPGAASDTSAAPPAATPAERP